ncbi:MAG: hypothetical protein IPK53_20615 [bacterium]|nr:hypothetical protein [bacterium]
MIQYSPEEALRLGHDFIGTEHLLLASFGWATVWPSRYCTTLGVIWTSCVSRSRDGDTTRGTKKIGNIPFTKRAEKVPKPAVYRG